MRIAIVNDAITATEALRRIVTAVPEHQLAWVAANGAEAVQRCSEDTPDLILMDLKMPVMDGTEATRQIMQHTPCAILIVTASVDAHTAKVFETLGAGALDAVSTPILGPEGTAGGAEALLAKIRIISRLVTGQTPKQNRPKPRSDATEPASLIAIGSSAGGPAVLATILGALPADFPASIVIVQHVDAQFAPSMASWLNDQTPLTVRTAQEGDQPQPGTALLAASNDHLIFTNIHTLGYTALPLDCSYRPSVDVFFQSVARQWKGQVAGILLTGMGRDGARGLKTLREAGTMTVAQDRASCAVYGMPKAAVELDAAMHILPPEQIARHLVNFLAHK